MADFTTCRWQGELEAAGAAGREESTGQKSGQACLGCARSLLPPPQRRSPPAQQKLPAALHPPLQSSWHALLIPPPPEPTQLCHETPPSAVLTADHWAPSALSICGT